MNSGAEYRVRLTAILAVFFLAAESSAFAQSNPCLNNPGPIAAVAASSVNGTVGVPVSLNASPSYDPNGSVVGYAWNFGDGSQVLSYQPNAIVQHNYASAGSFTAILWVKDNCGKVSNPGKNVFVTIGGGSGAPNQAPVVNAGPDRSITLPASASLAGSVSDDGLPAGAALTKTWSKVSGPGTVSFANASSPNTSASFSAPGNYVLRLTANDSLITASDEMSVNASSGGNPCANNQPPIANVGIDRTGTVGVSMSFSASLSSDPGGSIAGYQWSFGDGSSASGANVTHTYASVGVFNLTLTITDACGASAMDSALITIESAPQAPSSPQTLFVDNDAPGDLLDNDTSLSDPLEDGSTMHPFDSIQEAIDAAFTGDTIQIKPGMYKGPGNRNLVIQNKGITIKGMGSVDACLIDLNDGSDNSVFGFMATASSAANSVRIEGLKIIKARGSAISLSGGSPVIFNCTLMTNYGVGGAPALKLSGVSSGTLIERCNIKDNYATGVDISGSGIVRNCLIAKNLANSGVGGGGIRISGSITVRNCTVTGNVGQYFGGISATGGSPLIQNCIFWDNDRSQWNCNMADEVCLADDIYVQLNYCNIQNGEISTGCGTVISYAGLVNVNPQFLNTTSYRLGNNSPCVNAGAFSTQLAPNEKDIDGQSRLVGSRVDMGCDEK